MLSREDNELLCRVGRGTPMSFPRGMAVESVYVVRKPLAKTAERSA